MASSSGGGGGGIPVLQAMRSNPLSKPSSFRDLGLAVLKIVSYMCLGVLLYTFREVNEWPELGSGEGYDMPTDWSWDVLDCFYFTMVTITTVGYGDMPLLSQEMRVVTAFFGIVGVVQIASSLNVIAEWFVERARKRFMNRQRGLLQEAKRAGEMVRDQAPAAAPAGSFVADGSHGGRKEGRSRSDSRDAGIATAGADGMMMLESMSKADSPVASDSANNPSPPPSPPEGGGGAPSGPSKLNQVVPVSSSNADADAIADLVKGEVKRQSVGSIAQASQQEHLGGFSGFLASHPRVKYAYDMFMAFLPCLIFIILCFVLGVVENYSYDCYDKDKYPDFEAFLASGLCWSGVDSFYYAIITLSTIGYGDVTPHSKWGKLIATVLIPFAIVSLTNFMGKMHDIKVSKRMGFDKTLRERLEELHKVIQADDNGVVSPEEYILFNLKQMGKVDEDTVGLLREQFMALDADGSGELDATDLALLQKACDVMQGTAGSIQSPRDAAS